MALAKIHIHQFFSIAVRSFASVRCKVCAVRAESGKNYLCLCPVGYQCTVLCKFVYRKVKIIFRICCVFAEAEYIVCSHIKYNPVARLSFISCGDIVHKTASCAYTAAFRRINVHADRLAQCVFVFIRKLKRQCFDYRFSCFVEFGKLYFTLAALNVTACNVFLAFFTLKCNAFVGNHSVFEDDNAAADCCV